MERISRWKIINSKKYWAKEKEINTNKSFSLIICFYNYSSCVIFGHDCLRRPPRFQNEGQAPCPKKFSFTATCQKAEVAPWRTLKSFLSLKMAKKMQLS